MTQNNGKKILITIVTPWLILILFSLKVMADFVPVCGKVLVDLVWVESAGKIFVEYEAWPGFFRRLSITIPGIHLPGERLEPSSCELKLADQALQFTENFLAEAESIELHAIPINVHLIEHLETSLYTDQGSLIDALLRVGLARPDSSESSSPWC